MKTYSLIPSLLTVVLLFGHASLSATEPSPSERSEPVFDVLERREIELHNRKVIFKRVAQPDLPKRKLEQKPESREWTEEEQATLLERSAKKQETVLLQATVFDEVTELRWRHDGTDFRAWTNIDYHLLPGLLPIETAGTHFTFMIIATDVSREDHSSKWIPEAGDFDSTRADYFVVFDHGSEVTWNESAFQGIEAISAHYDLHQEDLRNEYAAREAVRLELVRELRENPPQPKDTVIHFWATDRGGFLNR